MKILHVIRTMNPAWGGPVEGVRNIAVQAMMSGHSLEIACVDDPQAEWLKTAGCQVNAIGAGKCGKFGYSSRLGPWLDSNLTRFDVVVANGIWMHFSSAVRSAAMRANIPYFVFPHGALDPWFRRKYPLKHLKKQAYWSLVEHKVLRDAAAVLFTTSEEQLASQGAFWPYKCTPTVVGYGIGDPLGSKARMRDRIEVRGCLKRTLPELGERSYLLFLGRVHEKKGIDLLLQAIARNGSHYREHAFVIAGPGTPAYVASLQAQATQLGLDKQVIWAGPLYDENKWAAIQEAEAYILPSHQENFGISVAEALACRVPVLISNKVNIWREIVSEGGGFAEDDDVSGTYRLLEQWSELSPMQRAAMRDNARRCFLRHFDIASTSGNLFSLFAERLGTFNNGALSECAS
jgi:glycosyltransferase involved in cell wall biosynthesis